MFLHQLTECSVSDSKTIYVLGINFIDDSWKILKNHDMHLNFSTLSHLSATSTSNLMITNVNYGQTTILQSLNDLQWIKIIQNRPDNSVQTFFDGGNVVEIGESILIKSIDEYCLQI